MTGERGRRHWPLGSLHRIASATLAAATVAAVVAISGIQPTRAAWNDTEYAAATFTAGVLNPVTSLSCGASSGLLATAVGFTWSQPDTATTGVVPSGYILAWTGTAGSGSVTVSGANGAIPGGLLSVLGTATITVTATRGSWTSTVSAVTRTVTTISALGVIVSWTCA